MAIDELVLMMCMGCPLLLSPHTPFERTMLLHADILTDPEASNVVSDPTTVSLPSLLTEGMYKSIALAGWKPSGDVEATPHHGHGLPTKQASRQSSQHHLASNHGSSSSSGDVNGAAGGGYDRFATLSGPHKTLAPGQLQWLSQQTKSLAWKLSATLGELHQSDRAKEVLRPTFGMVLPPVEDVEVAPASLSNEESTGGGEGGVEATDDANNAADGAFVGRGGGVGVGGHDSNDTENDPAEGDDSGSGEGQDTSVIKGSALDSVSLSRGSGVPIPHAGVIHPAGEQAQFLELCNDVYCCLSEALSGEEMIPFCV